MFIITMHKITMSHFVKLTEPLLISPITHTSDVYMSNNLDPNTEKITIRGHTKNNNLTNTQRDPIQRDPIQRDPIQHNPIQHNPIHREVNYNIKINIDPHTIISQNDNHVPSSILLLSWSIANALLYYYTNIGRCTGDACADNIDNRIYILLQWYVIINVYNMIAYVTISTKITISVIIFILKAYIMLSIIHASVIIFMLIDNSPHVNAYIIAILLVNVFLCTCMLL